VDHAVAKPRHAATRMSHWAIGCADSENTEYRVHRIAPVMGTMASAIGPGAKPMLRAEAIASLRRDTVKARCRGLGAMANSLEDQS
jgi:hypothetical protein